MKYFLLNLNSLQFILNKLWMFLFLILMLYQESVKTIGYHFEPMDLETCLGQFDVHHDTIIRTGESQAIGGKYLQGIGLNNLNECQRLCCETEHCDVYIFEEKAEGYCYLFECGSPENFHCKFTRHANYTSAVLTPPIKHVTSPPPSTLKTSVIIPHPPQSSQSQFLPASNSLSQHELELTNLKQQPDIMTSQQSKTLLTTKSPSNIVVGAADSANQPNGFRLSEQNTTPKNKANTSICGRFQFQCHSGECIAVYNACDGIPQCEDGSDEGPECPSTIGTGIKNNIETSKITDVSNYRVTSGNVVAVPLSKQTMQVLPRQYQQQSQVQIPIINNREDPMSAPQIWPNRKGQEVQTDMERNSHIFNHKGGIQLTTNNNNNNLSPQYQNSGSNIYNPIQRDMYMQGDIQNNYRNGIIQSQDQLIPPSNINWQQAQIQQQSLIPPGPYVIAVNGQPVPQIKSVPVSSQSQINVKIKAENIKSNDPLTHSETINDEKSTQNHKDNEKEKSSAEQSDDYSYYEEKSTEPPKKKQRKHKKISTKDKDKIKKEHKEKTIEAPVHEKYKMTKDEFGMEFVDHDGQSERPGGAVLSLTLGIIVTAALAILIGCRMRTVGRRIRRIGKTPYAHDADFLVNGMYL